MIDSLLQLVEFLRLSQVASLATSLFGRIDPYTLALAAFLQTVAQLYTLRRKLRKDPPPKVLCAKRDVDSQLDDYLREIWVLEQPMRLWYLARHNKHGNYISLIGCNMDEIYSDQDEISGRLDYRPLASWETIAARINHTGVGAADLRPVDCGPVWHRIFDSAGFARIWIIQIDLHEAAGGRDHRGYLVFGWSKEQVNAIDPAELQLISRGPDGPVLNLNSHIHSTANRAGYRAAEVLEEQHYSRRLSDRLREAGTNLLVHGAIDAKR